MSDLPTLPPTPQKVAQQSAREKMHHRVQGYKRGLTVAALLGFGAFGVLIGHPYLNTTTTSSTTTTQTTTSGTTSSSNQPSSSGNYFNQQGGSSSASTSTQSPATSSGTS